MNDYTVTQWFWILMAFQKPPQSFWILCWWLNNSLSQHHSETVGDSTPCVFLFTEHRSSALCESWREPGSFEPCAALFQTESESTEVFLNHRWTPDDIKHVKPGIYFGSSVCYVRVLSCTVQNKSRKQIKAWTFWAFHRGLQLLEATEIPGWRRIKRC